MSPTQPSSGAARRNPRHRRPRAQTTVHQSQVAAAGHDSGAIDLTPADSVVDAPDFAVLGVPASIIAVLERGGVTTPFPIQSATLPDSLAGRDVLGRGKTGSGKTIAFAIPTAVRLAGSGTRREAKRPRALIMVPTRELANQVAEALAPIAAAMSLRITTVFGGVGQSLRSE